MHYDGPDGHLTERAHQAMIDNGFEPEFPGDVAAQLRQIMGGGEPTPDPSIKDLRSLLWSSIDNASSRDLDQIEFAEALPNGDIRVLVGIADVDSVVKKDSPIDQHAADRIPLPFTPKARSFPCCPRNSRRTAHRSNQGQGRRDTRSFADMIVKENGDVPESTFYQGDRCETRQNLSYEEYWPVARRQGRRSARGRGNLPGLSRTDRAAATGGGPIAANTEPAKGALDFESIESAAVVEDGKNKRHKIGLSLRRPES